ncbi:MAG: hypothetical protein EB060_00315 [Proteobacteria bacterium]|nr:hypothetical protein [Pseudomonadota bacterium]
MKRFFLSLILVLFPVLAVAQIALSPQDSDKPVEITADSLKVVQADKVAVFEGNVEAIQGNINLKSNRMTVYYRGGDSTAPKGAKDAKKKAAAPASGMSPGGSNSVSKILVEGNVFLKTAGETAQSEKGLYDVEKALVTLEQNVVLTKEKNVLKGNKLVYEMKTGKSQLFGGSSGGQGGRVKGLFIPDKGMKH